MASCFSETADEDKSEAQRGTSESSTASELPVVAMLLLSVEATRRAALLAHLFIKNIILRPTWPMMIRDT